MSDLEKREWLKAAIAKKERELKILITESRERQRQGSAGAVK